MSRKVHRCLIGSCRKPLCNDDILYHKFTKIRFERWMKALGRNSDENLSFNNVICSRHFLDEDYFFKNGRKTLKANAIPSKNMPLLRNINNDLAAISAISSIPEINTTSTNMRLISEVDAQSKVGTVLSPTKKQRVNDIENKSIKMPLTIMSVDKINKKYSNSYIASRINLSSSYILSPNKNNEQEIIEKVANIEPQFKTRRLKLRQKLLPKKVTHLKFVVSCLKKRKLINEDAADTLIKTFSYISFSTMKRMLGYAKRIKITKEKYPETMKKFAITLQFYSAKAYDYTRKIFDIALPLSSEIRNWMTSVNCEPGFTDQAFKTLTEKVRKNAADGFKTICCLMLDEVQIKKQIDFSNNKMWGYVNLGCQIDNNEIPIAKEALVLMVVAINGDWKIPIAYFFTNSLKNDNKENIIKLALIKLHETNVIITAITGDGPAPNFSLMSKLGAQIDNEDPMDFKPYFYHPSDKNLKVFIFFDSCHMIKLLGYNWAIINNFKDPDGNLVNFEFIRYFFELKEDKHLNFEAKMKELYTEWKSQNNKVDFAVRIFSHSVADALEYLMTNMRHPYFVGAEATIKFIRIVHSLFDLLNTRSLIGHENKTPIKQDNREKWEPIFMDALDYFLKCTTIDNELLINSPKKSPFKAFIITISSLIGLFNMYVLEKTYLKYILTYKFSQDHMELFFCNYRWGNNQSALQFYNTYRKMLMDNEIKNIPRKDVNNKISTNNNFDLYNQEINDHNYAIPISPSLNLLAENVTFIAGFIIEIARKQLKCSAIVSQ